MLRGRRLRSRVYLPAHQPGLAEGGIPGERYIDYHRRRARAGLGMQITGATPVIWSEVWADGLTLVNIDERIVPGYRRLAAAVHAEGGLMLAQLAHVGAMETAGDTILSASAIRSELTQRTARAATEEDLDAVLAAYGAAAVRCRAGDLDGIEVTMAHGMLLASFLSPLMNTRTDRYGGDLAGRTLFPRMVVSAVREAIGADAIVGIRLPGDELVAGGLRAEDAASIAARLVASGEVDYVSVTAGNNAYKLARVDHWPPTPAPHGAFRHLSRAVKQAVNVPVATVGRVTTLALAEAILQAGDADLVGMVRANVADPELLPKSRSGLAAHVRPCIGANVCINALLAHKPLTCLANPDVGQPGSNEPEGWGVGRRAIVVGAGPGGLEAARRLVLGGWQTTLVDRDTAIGGQMARWSSTPSRTEFKSLIRWWGTSCERHGVTMRLGTTATAESLLDAAPDLVVIATGSMPIARPVPRSGDAPLEIGPYEDVASGGHVLVRDEMGGVAALLTAERLSLTARRVTLVTSMLHPGEGDGLTTVYPLLRDCAARGIDIVDRAKVIRLDGRTAVLEGTFGEVRPAITDVDVMVSVLDTVACDTLVRPLAAQGLQAIVLGDARLPRDVASAVADGAALINGLAATVMKGRSNGLSMDGRPAMSRS